MNKDYHLVSLKEISSNVSEKFDFENTKKVIFLNTGDVLNNKILHNNLSKSNGLPGQAKKAIRNNDILFSEIRPANKRFAFIDFDARKFVVSTKFMIIRSHEKIYPKYLYYFLTSKFLLNELQRIAESRSGTFPQITFDAISHIHLKLFNKNNQSKIISIIEAYDKLIENNTRRIQILEEMAQRIYKEWFVDFKYPGHENDQLVDSKLGMIPEKWEVKNLDYICNITMGQSPKSKYYNDNMEGLPFHQGVRDFGNRFPNDRIYCTVENRVAYTGDILFSVRAPVGRINIANKKIVIGRGLSAIKSKSGNQVFVLEQLKYRFNKVDIMGSGTIYKAITKADLAGVKMLNPKESIISKFEQIADPIFSELGNLTDKNTNIRQTRDLLLPKLISGKVDVSDMDIDTSILND